MGINEESESPESREAALTFICKRLYLNYTKLTDEGKKWLARTAEKSDLLKNPNPQRGRKEEVGTVVGQAQHRAKLARYWMPQNNRKKGSIEGFIGGNNNENNMAGQV